MSEVPEAPDTGLLYPRSRPDDRMVLGPVAKRPKAVPLHGEDRGFESRPGLGSPPLPPMLRLVPVQRELGAWCGRPGQRATETRRLRAAGFALGAGVYPESVKAERQPPRSAPKDEANAYERFESLARRLVAVPKKELERKAKTHERKKQERS